jgi:hypothetical protein
MSKGHIPRRRAILLVDFDDLKAGTELLIMGLVPVANVEYHAFIYDSPFSEWVAYPANSTAKQYQIPAGKFRLINQRDESEQVDGERL